MTRPLQFPQHFPEIISGDLRIVEFGEQHLTPRYVAWLNDPETVRFSEQRHRVHTIESCRDYYEEEKVSPNYFLAIEEQQYGHIGNMKVAVDKNNRLGDLSILIGEKHVRGRGLGRAAWRLVLEKCLTCIGFRMITAGTMETNLPMLSIFESCHMNIEATLPKRFLWEEIEIGWVSASLHFSEWTLDTN